MLCHSASSQFETQLGSDPRRKKKKNTPHSRPREFLLQYKQEAQQTRILSTKSQSLRPVNRSVWTWKKHTSSTVLTACQTHVYPVATAFLAKSWQQAAFTLYPMALKLETSNMGFRIDLNGKRGEVSLDLLNLGPHNDGVVFAYLLLPMLLVVKGTLVLVRVPMKTAVQPPTPTLEPCNNQTV